MRIWNRIEAGHRLQDDRGGGKPPVRQYHMATDEGDRGDVSPAVRHVLVEGTAKPGAEQQGGAQNMDPLDEQVSHPARLTMAIIMSVATSRGRFLVTGPKGWIQYSGSPTVISSV